MLQRLLVLLCLPLFLTACTASNDNKTPDATSNDITGGVTTIPDIADFSSIQTVGAPNIDYKNSDGTPYTDFDTAYSVAYHSNTDKEYILPMLAVERKYIGYHRRGQEQDFSDDTRYDEERLLIKFEDSVAKIILGGETGYGISDGTLYVGNDIYEVGGFVHESERLSFMTATVGERADNRRNFDFNNASSAFDFTPKYMMRVRWSTQRRNNSIIETVGILEDTEIIQSGYGLVGIETDGAQIPKTTEIVQFHGQGIASIYDNDFTNITDNVIADFFTITADVDFFASKAQFTGELATTDYNEWNFTTPMLEYQAGVNHILGNVSAVNNATGTLEARFYGSGDNAAEELGGTLILASENGYKNLIGVFGATSVDNSANLNPNPNSPDSYTSFAQASDDANYYDDEALTLTFGGITVEESYSAIVTRSDTNVNWDDGTKNKTSNAYDDFAGVSLIFDDFGDIVDTYIVAGGGSYGITDYSNSYPTELSGPIDNASLESFISVSRDMNNGSDSAYNFIADHMLAIGWYEQSSALSDNALTGTDAYKAGYAIAGFETDGGNIPTDGTAVEFLGNGKGYYQGKLDDYNVKFDITATVDFENYNVVLVTSNSYDTDDGNEVAHLNIKGTLSYGFESNYLAGSDFVTQGDDGDIDALDNTELTGTANARFYGTVAEELGGTFYMKDTNIDNYYYGHFGAKRGMSDDGSTGNPKSPDSYMSFSEASDDADIYDEAITLTFSGIAVEETYSADIERTDPGITEWADGNITETLTIADGFAGVSLIFDGYPSIIYAVLVADSGSYDITNYGNSSSTELSGPLDGVDDSFDSLFSISREIDDSDDSDYNFTADHMVAIYWYEETSILPTDYTTENGTDAYKQGYAVAGFETAGGDIPTGGTAVEFLGNGKGVYQGGGIEYDVIFDVKATVDFENDNVAVETSNSADGLTDDTVNHLNVKGTLSYVSETNYLAGSDFVTQGADGDFDISDTDNTELTGSANARFYGTAAEELGGTFNLTKDDTHFYYGYFGAKK